MGLSNFLAHSAMNSSNRTQSINKSHHNNSDKDSSYNLSEFDSFYDMILNKYIEVVKSEIEQCRKESQLLIGNIEVPNQYISELNELLKKETAGATYNTGLYAHKGIELSYNIEIYQDEVVVYFNNFRVPHSIFSDPKDELNVDKWEFDKLEQEINDSKEKINNDDKNPNTMIEQSKLTRKIAELETFKKLKSISPEAKELLSKINNEYQKAVALMEQRKKLVELANEMERGLKRGIIMDNLLDKTFKILTSEGLITEELLQRIFLTMDETYKRDSDGQFIFNNSRFGGSTLYQFKSIMYWIVKNIYNNPKLNEETPGSKVR